MDINNTISSGLLELYVLGLASDQETVQVQQLAQQYPEVAAEIVAIETSLQSYAIAHAVQPSVAVREKIFAGINNNTHETSTPAYNTGKVVGMYPVWKYAAAAAILLLIGSAVFNVVFYTKYQEANKNYAAVVAEKNNVQDQLASLEQSNRDMKNDMGVMQSKYTEPVALHGLPAAPDAAAKIFWMKNTGDVYIDPSNLAAPPAGKQYQLWAIVDGKPVDGGMIISSKNGDKYRIQKMKSFGKAEAFAITLETEGGNPTPKGEMIVMGKM